MHFWNIISKNGGFRLLRLRAAHAIVLPLLAALACLMMFAVIAVLWRSQQNSVALAKEIKQLNLQIKQKTNGAASALGGDPATAEQTDFSRKLPADSDALVLLQELERSTASANIAFTAVQREDHLSTLEQLAHTDLTVTLRGSYPLIKSVLVEMLTRFPNATLAQWRMRRAAQPTDIDATAVIAVWAPAQGAPVALSSLPSADRVAR